LKKAVLILFLMVIAIMIIFPDQTASRNKDARRPQQNYFSVSTGCGATFPLGDLSPAFNIAVTPIAAFDYNFIFRWGVLGLGIFTGCNIQKTSDEAAYQSLFLSVPAAVQLKYTTNSNFPLYGYEEANGGMTVNMFRY